MPHRRLIAETNMLGFNKNKIGLILFYMESTEKKNWYIQGCQGTLVEEMKIYTFDLLKTVLTNVVL